MCLAVPMRIINIQGSQAEVSLAGLRKKINLGLLQEVRIGEYVMVHAGFAIEKVNEKEARKTLSALQEMRRSL